VRNSVAMENEYARIVLEQGIPGLCAWVLFLAWVFTRNQPAYRSWALSRRLMRAGGAAAFASGMLGIGLLTSIPSTALLLLTAGWIAVPERIPEPARSAQQLASFRLTSA
jgi:O-antigen ligase